MRARVTLSIALLLSACRTTSPGTAAPDASEARLGVRYSWSTTLRGAPTTAEDVRVELAVPRRASLRDLRAVALVGNAPFEVRLPEREPGRFASGPLVLEWTPHGTSAALVIATRGRVPEIGLRFVADESEDAEALARELRTGTQVEIDGRACAADGRLERVR